MIRKNKKGKIPTPITVTTRLSEAEMYRLQALAARERSSICRLLRSLIAAACEKRIEADAA